MNSSIAEVDYFLRMPYRPSRVPRPHVSIISGHCCEAFPQRRYPRLVRNSPSVSAIAFLLKSAIPILGGHPQFEPNFRILDRLTDTRYTTKAGQIDRLTFSLRRRRDGERACGY